MGTPTPESLVVSHYINALDPEWHIFQEVKGRCFEKNKRIDAIIKHKQHPSIIFGIEFKRDDLHSFTDFTGWIKQSVSYSFTTFEGFGKIPVLICPGIDYGNKDINFFTKRMVGEFGIGELKKFTDNYRGTYYRILFKDSVFWDSGTGFRKNALSFDFSKNLSL